MEIKRVQNKSTSVETIGASPDTAMWTSIEEVYARRKATRRCVEGGPIPGQTDESAQMMNWELGKEQRKHLLGARGNGRERRAKKCHRTRETTSGSRVVGDELKSVEEDEEELDESFEDDDVDEEEPAT
ncbi:hypothetical protein B0H14DRAFT_2559996 [Mycena olivaceomarginata]|nr:hypothetical protein B0H14DRAFT_2559996 [Mycena olivaceomarginata]